MATDPSPWVRVVAVVNHRNRTAPQVLSTVDSITSDDEVAQRRAEKIIERATLIGHPLPNLAASQTAWVVPLPADILTLIDNLTDPDPCEYDHHGTCQLHGQGSDPVCATATAQKLLSAARAEGMIR